MAAAVFGISLLFLAIFRHQALFYPPYWDAIVGPFNEAVWLAENRFDYVALARDELGYSQGGPRSYFFSLVPGLQAALMRLFETREAFLLVDHLLMIGLASGCIALLFGLARDLWGWPRALVASALLLFHPLFLSQAYSLGMEIPTLFFGLWGVSRWVRGSSVTAGLLLLVCFGVKASGLVLCLAVALAHLLTEFRGRRDLGTLAWLVLPAALYGVEALVSRLAFQSHEPDMWLAIPGLPDLFVRFLDDDPLLFMGLVGVIVGFGCTLARADRSSWARFREVLAGRRLALVCALVCVQVYAASALVTLFLSRYFLIALPFVVLGLLWLAFRSAPRLAFALAPVVLAHYAWTAFAEPRGAERTMNNGHQLERTLAYEDDLELDLELVELLRTHYADSVVVTSRPFVQMLGHRGFQYLDEPLEVVSTDSPSLRWLGVPHLQEMDFSRPGLVDRVIWVWAPNDFSRQNRPDTFRDRLIEKLERGNRRVFVFRRDPHYYRAVSIPGFRGWDDMGRGFDDEALAHWEIEPQPGGAGNGR